MLTRRLAQLFTAVVMLPMCGEDCCQNAVAVLDTLSGHATLRAAHTQTIVAVSRLDWLPDGSTLEVGKGSRATLILLSGLHFELGAGARATVTADALIRTSGRVRKLEPLPPLPKPAPIADDASQRGAVVRFRPGQGLSQIRSLYPREGMAALPDSVRLSFSVVPGASAYKVDLLDETGNSLRAVQSASTEVAVPKAMLEPGARYQWRVRAIGAIGVIAEGAAQFVTLSVEDMQRRTAFASALHSKADDSSALALLASVDRRLGLLAEAREEFGAALHLKPTDPAIKRALALAEAALAEDGK